MVVSCFDILFQIINPPFAVTTQPGFVLLCSTEVSRYVFRQKRTGISQYLMIKTFTSRITKLKLCSVDSRTGTGLPCLRPVRPQFLFGTMPRLYRYLLSQLMSPEPRWRTRSGRMGLKARPLGAARGGTYILWTGKNSAARRPYASRMKATSSLGLRSRMREPPHPPVGESYVEAGLGNDRDQIPARIIYELAYGQREQGDGGKARQHLGNVHDEVPP